ncbi:DNA polymerase V [Klebsiella pneumoniae]|uniref:DNA polymerase V n=5 Tax=Klebsiella pneumoniae TaxID=573 RepID=UPI0035186D70
MPTATFSGGEVMPRNSDIEIAWRQAIVIEPNGRRTVTTSGFIRELAKVNWIWSLRQANQWIEHYVTTFRDVSTQEGDDRTFQLYNPNGGL